MSAPAEELQRLIRTLYPEGRLVGFTELGGGVSARTIVLEVALPTGGQKVVARWQNAERLRRCPEAAVLEHHTLLAAHAAGLAVPQPLRLEGPCLLIEHVDAAPELDPADQETFLRQFVSHLVGIHRVDPATFAHLPGAAEAVARRLATPPDQLDASLREGEVRAALGAAWPPTSWPSSRCLLHGDFWPGNLLWRGGRLVSVIDWEEATLGNPLIDLAICRLDILWLLGLQAMQLLTELYGASSQADLAPLPIYDLYAALRPAGQLKGWAEVYPAFGRPDITEASMRERHGQFVTMALHGLARL